MQEAYARIFPSIVKGGGPTGSFRAYLFTSIRNTAAGWGRARRKTPIDELELVPDPDAEAHATDEALDRSLTHRAFRSLPTRWQEVLWYTEIEQMKPAEVAPLLGMKATAVAQLAFRAREGVRGLSPLIGTSRELARAVVGADGTVTVQFTVPATDYLLGRAHVAYLIDDAPAGDATRIW